MLSLRGLKNVRVVVYCHGYLRDKKIRIQKQIKTNLKYYKINSKKLFFSKFLINSIIFSFHADGHDMAIYSTNPTGPLMQLIQ